MKTITLSFLFAVMAGGVFGANPIRDEGLRLNTNISATATEATGEDLPLFRKKSFAAAYDPPETQSIQTNTPRLRNQN